MTIKILGQKTTFSSNDSGFSQWLNVKDITKKDGTKPDGKENRELPDSSYSSGIIRDSLPSIHQGGKHSEHSSLHNIQGDLNDILDRLQNMVANDCLLEGRIYSLIYIIELV